MFVYHRQGVKISPRPNREGLNEKSGFTGAETSESPESHHGKRYAKTASVTELVAGESDCTLEFERPFLGDSLQELFDSRVIGLDPGTVE